jgi:hypothetical protein
MTGTPLRVFHAFPARGADRPRAAERTSPRSSAASRAVGPTAVHVCLREGSEGVIAGGWPPVVKSFWLLR